MTKAPKANEITLERVYEAPVKKVWDAWADTEQVTKWWGPRGFSITNKSQDLRVGGSWVYTMHGPDGKDYLNQTVYLEVEPNVLLVYDHGFEGQPPLFRATARFHDLGTKTRLELTMALPTAEIAEGMRKHIKKAGGDSNWDRLAEYLADAEGRNRFFINRVFAAPVAAVFRAWANAGELARWLPPAGAEMKFVEGEIRAGGSTFSCMEGVHGRLFVYAEYRELVLDERIVYTQQFRNAERRLARHPLAPLWPETMLTTVLFTEERPGFTRVTLSWEPEGKVSGAEHEVFRQAKAGMTMGWTGSFDKLEELLRARP
jgi:uncharacterized protein YndB with AHSA1/START domain